MRTALIAATALVSLSAGTVRADPVAQFYSGKTISIIIGTGPGASYGDYAQLVARHMGRHIPGGPNLIVQSMPGAGGLVALNHLAQRAPRDGTVISVIHVTLVQDGIFNPKAQFDPVEFQWIGRLAGISFLGVASRASGVRSLDEARRREVTTGAPGPNNVPAQAPQVLNRIAGTKFKVISGYKGNAEVLIALERGEIDMAVGTIATLKVGHWDKLERGDLVPIFAQAAQRVPGFPSIPTLIELATTDAQRAFIGVFTSTAEIGRALSTPPGIPADRLAALRAAFDHMIAETSFKTDATRARLDLEPKSGDEMQRLVRAAATMSPEVRNQARTFYDEVLKN